MLSSSDQDGSGLNPEDQIMDVLEADGDVWTRWRRNGDGGEMIEEDHRGGAWMKEKAEEVR